MLVRRIGISSATDPSTTKAAVKLGASLSALPAHQGEEIRGPSSRWIVCD